MLGLVGPAQCAPLEEINVESRAAAQLNWSPAPPVIEAPHSFGKPVVKLADFEQKGVSTWQAFENAIEACRREEAGALVLEPKRYLFDDPAAAGKQAHLLFEGLHDLVIEGNGAELIFHHIKPGIYFLNCQRVALKQVSIDWDIRLASAGVVELDAEGRRVIKVLDEFPVTPEMPVTAFTEYHIEQRRWALDPAEQYNPAGVELIAPQTYYCPGLVGVFTPGKEVLIRHYVYQAIGIGFMGLETSDIACEDVTIWQCPSHAFLAAMCEGGIRLTRCRIQRKDEPDRLISATADGAHFMSLKGDILIEDCDFSYQGDDSVNIHGMWCQVAEIVDDHTVKLAGKFVEGTAITASPGDEIKFCKAANLAELGRLALDHIALGADGKSLLLKTVEALPEGLELGDFLGNMNRACNRYIIRGNYFHDHRARGMLIQAKDGLIENNHVARTMAGALNLTVDCNYWTEGFGIERLIVRGNTFETCNWAGWERHGSGVHMGMVSLAVDTKTGPGDYPVHHQVLFENNTFIDTPGLALFLSGCEDVVVRNNRLVGCNAEPFPGTGRNVGVEAQGSIFIARASKVTVYGTTQETPGGSFASGVVAQEGSTSDIVIEE